MPPLLRLSTVQLPPVRPDQTSDSRLWLSIHRSVPREPRCCPPMKSRVPPSFLLRPLYLLPAPSDQSSAANVQSGQLRLHSAAGQRPAAIARDLPKGFQSILWLRWCLQAFPHALPSHLPGPAPTQSDLLLNRQVSPTTCRLLRELLSTEPPAV